MASGLAERVAERTEKLAEIEAELIKFCCSCKRVDCRYGTCENLVLKRRELKNKLYGGGKKNTEYRVRKAQRFTFEGRSLTLYEWERVIGVRRETLRRRLRNGWSLEKTFSTPLRGQEE